MRLIWQLPPDMVIILAVLILSENGQLIECQIEAIPTKSYILIYQ